MFKHRKIILLVLLIFLGISGVFLFNPPVNTAKLSEIEKDYRKSDGSYYYHSHVRLPLNPGLPRFLSDKRDMLLKQHSNSNIVFLIVHKPEVSNDWNDVRGLGLRLLAQVKSGKGIDLGHVQWGWSCIAQNQRVEGASGYTGEQRDQGIELGLQGWGATAAIMTFTDGYFEGPWSVQVKAQSSDHSKFAVLPVLTTSASCEKLLTTYQELRFKRGIRDFQLISNDGEINVEIEGGMNCGTVAAALFSEIGRFPIKIFKDSHKSWKIPIIYFGYPQIDLPRSIKISNYWESQLREVKGVSVDIGDALANKNSSRRIKVSFLDPNSLYEAIKKLPPLLDLR